VIGVNISREQVREGRLLIDALGLSEQVELHRGNALSLAFPDRSFDAVLCIEVAADICVTENARGNCSGLVAPSTRRATGARIVGNSDRRPLPVR
jgi:hypothetical protein